MRQAARSKRGELDRMTSSGISIGTPGASCPAKASGGRGSIVSPDPPVVSPDAGVVTIVTSGGAPGRCVVTPGIDGTFGKVTCGVFGVTLFGGPGFTRGRVSSAVIGTGCSFIFTI